MESDSSNSFDCLQRDLKMLEIHVDALAARTARFASIDRFIGLLVQPDSLVTAADIQRYPQTVDHVRVPPPPVSGQQH